MELSGYADVLDRFVANGFVGVPLFFVLSGFVLTYNYIGRDARFGTSATAFYVARFARIYPVYLLAFVLFTPSALFTRAIPPGHMAATVSTTLTLTQSWAEQIYWNRPGWTVSTEAFFYLSFPLLAPAMCRLGRRRLLWAIAILWLLGALPVAALQAFAPSDPIWVRVVKHNPLARLPEFLIGVAVGKLFLDRNVEVWRRGRARWVGARIACLVVACVGIAAAWNADTTGAWYLLAHNGLFAPLFGLLIYELARGDWLLRRLPGAALMILLGEASYAIYILQTPIHGMCMGVATLALGGDLASRHAVTESELFAGGYILVLIGCSILCLRWYEVPARALIRRLVPPRQGRHSGAPEPARTNNPAPVAALARAQPRGRAALVGIEGTTIEPVAPPS